MVDEESDIKQGLDESLMKQDSLDKVSNEFNVLSNELVSKSIVSKMDRHVIPFVLLGLSFKSFSEQMLWRSFRMGMSKELDIPVLSTMTICVLSLGAGAGVIIQSIMMLRIRTSLHMSIALGLWAILQFVAVGIKTKVEFYAFVVVFNLLNVCFFTWFLTKLFLFYRGEPVKKPIAFFMSAPAIGQFIGGKLHSILYRYFDGYQSITAWKWLSLLQGCFLVVMSISAAFIIPEEEVGSRLFKFDQQEIEFIEYNKKTPLPKEELKKTFKGAWKYFFGAFVVSVILGGLSG